ncbi:MAG: hypothetical protein K5762_01315 [Bacilli bacterium]|nr:hypothetical protein [Bacilli bacterium]
MSKLSSTIYYTDELNDEFSTMSIKTPKITKDYKYLRTGFFGRLLHVLAYYVISKPLAWCYLKLKFHHKIVGKEKLKDMKKRPLFLYGNHTQIIGDALIPTFIMSPRSVYTIVHPNNVAIPLLGKFTPYLGGLPLPSDLGATRNFMKATDTLVKKNKAIVIYPEAHLWPYYTKIRPFLATSFHYPVKYDTPTYCFTNTYHQRKNAKKVKIITYIDGPFYPQAGLDDIQAREDLRQKVYQAMTSRALTSDKELIHYVRREDHD